MNFLLECEAEAEAEENHTMFAIPPPPGQEIVVALGSRIVIYSGFRSWILQSRRVTWTWTKEMRPGFFPFIITPPLPHAPKSCARHLNYIFNKFYKENKYDIFYFSLATGNEIEKRAF